MSDRLYLFNPEEASQRGIDDWFGKEESDEFIFDVVKRFIEHAGYPKKIFCKDWHQAAYVALILEYEFTSVPTLVFYAESENGPFLELDPDEISYGMYG